MITLAQLQYAVTTLYGHINVTVCSVFSGANIKNALAHHMTQVKINC